MNFSQDLQTRYLEALGVAAAPPSAKALAQLAQAHVGRFAHDTVWMSRGRQPSVDDVQMAECLLAGEGGACVHLNWGFAGLLTSLGYEVVRHRALTQTVFDARPHDDSGGHTVLTVIVDDVRWYVDVGLGNGLLTPVPLAESTVTQGGGFTYSLERGEAGEWRFLHDRKIRGITVVQFQDVPADPDEVDAVYRMASVDGDSPFVQNITASRRLSDHVLMLAGDVLVRRDSGGRKVTRLSSAEEWESVLRSDFMLGLPEMGTEERAWLWAKASRGA